MQLKTDTVLTATERSGVAAWVAGKLSYFSLRLNAFFSNLMVFDDYGTDKYTSLTALPQDHQGYKHVGSSLVRFPVKNTDRFASFTGFIVQDKQVSDVTSEVQF